MSAGERGEGNISGPLYGGVALLVLAATGAALSLAQTPERIDETWLVDVCQHISGPPSLEELMLEALEEGKKFDVQLPGGGQEPDSAHRPEVLHQ